jgi:hypothetical protein
MEAGGEWQVPTVEQLESIGQATTDQAQLQALANCLGVAYPGNNVKTPTAVIVAMTVNSLSAPPCVPWRAKRRRGRKRRCRLRVRARVCRYRRAELRRQ